MNEELQVQKIFQCPRSITIGEKARRIGILTIIKIGFRNLTSTVQIIFAG